jgi:sugar phosphate isomerase/epimerase
MHDARFSSPRVQADMLKELGYDGLAYLGDPEGLREMLKALDAKHLRMFATYLYPDAEIDIDSDPPAYDPRIKDMIDALKGRETLLLLCLVAHSHSPSSPEGDEHAVRIVRDIADYAQQAGVRLAVYPHERYWVQSVEDAVRIVKKADRKNLGICFNLYHWLKTNQARDPRPTIDMALPYLFLVTINGSTPEGSYETLDRGAFDVCPLLRTLREVGYSGPIGLQCVGIQGDPRENLRRSIDAWRNLSSRISADEE